MISHIKNNDSERLIDNLVSMKGIWHVTSMSSFWNGFCYKTYV